MTGKERCTTEDKQQLHYAEHSDAIEETKAKIEVNVPIRTHLQH